MLADARDRILLFRFADANSDVPGRVWWTTPGGGVAEGESLPRAAARELFEETGLRVPVTAFERVVAHSEGAARYRGHDDWYEHHFFFHRISRSDISRSDDSADIASDDNASADIAADDHPTTSAFELDESRWEAAERSTIAEHRWWTAAELAATTETVYPPGLARILPDLLSGHPPATPIDINHP